MKTISALLELLRQDVKNMQPGDDIYEMLKEELTLRGEWNIKEKSRGKPRGRPFPKGHTFSTKEHRKQKKAEEE